MMKLLFCSILALAINIKVRAQVNPYWGIHPIDSCWLEDPCLILLDDSIGSGIWQLGKPNKVLFDAAFSPVNAMVTDTVGLYSVNNHSYFDLGYDNTQNYPLGIILSFWHKYDTDAHRDGGYVEVSYDWGQSWNNVINDFDVHPMMDFNTENLYALSDTLPDGIPAFTGMSQGWVHTKIQWVWEYPIKSNVPEYLMFRFHFISDSIETNQEGWMIDNISIEYADLGSSIHENSRNISDLTFVPNPVNTLDKVRFENVLDGKVVVQLFDGVGKLVNSFAHSGKGWVDLQLDHVSPGIYWVTLSQEGSAQQSGKLVVR